MSEPFAKIIAYSISPQKIPLVTLHLRYWRAIHSEINTHRAFSRNARSSRAVPVAKMLDEIRNDPFIPRHWGKNQKGMQAVEECDEPIKFRYDTVSREDAWLRARDVAVDAAQRFANAGYHKQIVNRLLEPFMWIDTLVTATDWANFFALRDHKDAEPHIRDLARLVKETIEASSPQPLEPGQWHLPYIRPGEFAHYETARQVSAARCARISYAPFDDNASVEAELERFAKLITDWPVHASPVEHQATPDTLKIENHSLQWEHPNEHRNFRGWRQFRARIPGETVRDPA